ncbi:type 1 glutamine amidotransferase domain-containing protein [Streptomyces sp. NPDC058434]|uniref:type 1 glutamine amidotransferase domain-containing protein n=1 Tax=Streptomyces sp. NPDC058434 TaxID=3346498 RepID=UPI00364CED6C
MKRTVLIVLTNRDKLGDTEMPTGVCLSEAAHPWAALCAAGLEVELGSPHGGRPRLTAIDPKDPRQAAFLADASMSVMFDATVPLTVVDPSRYCALWLAGGRGALWDFPDNKEIGRIGRQILDEGGVVAAVGHGGAGLLPLLDDQGGPLISGKRVAAFSDQEEAAVGLRDVLPFSLQERLQTAGALYEHVPSWAQFALVDGDFITGQNPQSVRATAQLAVEVLENRGLLG